MRTITEFPHDVEEIENVFIPMRDGVRLAARIWLPKSAQGAPVPAVLEYIPYRKRFGTAVRDAVTHGYLSGHGYACIRVDLRGSGESDGVLKDEYLQTELDDGVEVISWLAEQPWCDGNVGMMGMSWGGFNSLQIAALQPPALKAIVTVASTDDRYSDDVHHMGGCLLGDNLSWASVMFAYNTLPPDPALVGERWREMWHERLEHSGLWLDTWLRHQRRDAYWAHGSICEDYSAVRCPVYAVSGWADGYSNAVFRLVERLSCPRRGLIGPWGHRYPHFGEPGPAIGFLQEMLRWWDQWLKGHETGIMDEPVLQVWLQDSVPPTTSYAHRPGRWVGARSWPSPDTGEIRMRLEPYRLVDENNKVPDVTTDIQSPLTLGLFAGKWCSYAASPDLAHDQRQEDGGALVFQTRPLEAPIEILGTPCVELELACNRPVAMIAARLSDVAPDGKATRVSYGLLNLTHRDSSEHPLPLVPGQRYRVSVQLNGCGQHFPAGNRIRLALSTSYWPLAWPPPEPASLTIWLAASSLVLPVYRPCEPVGVTQFEAPVGAPEPQRVMLEPEHRNWLVHRDLASDESTLEVIDDRGMFRFEDIDLTVCNRGRELYTMRADDFESVRGETRWERGLSRGDWRVRSLTRTVLTSTSTYFELEANLDAFEGERRFFSRNWHSRIPRDLV